MLLMFTFIQQVLDGMFLRDFMLRGVCSVSVFFFGGILLTHKILNAEELSSLGCLYPITGVIAAIGQRSVFSTLSRSWESFVKLTSRFRVLEMVHCFIKSIKPLFSSFCSIIRRPAGAILVRSY